MYVAPGRLLQSTRMKWLLRHAVVASGIEFPRHNHDATAAKNAAEKKVQLMHRYYVLLDLKLIVRFYLVITLMTVNLRRGTNGISYPIIHMLQRCYL